MVYNPKKEKIIETARNIFSRFGIKKSTMDEIARKIRMAKSTLYHYFKNKEDIFLEVVKRESATMKVKLKEAIEAAGTPQDKFRAYARTRMVYLKELDNYYSTLTDAYFEFYPFTEGIRRDFTNFEMECLEGIFKEGVEKGVFDIKRTKITAQMVNIAFKGFEYLMITKEEPLNVENELDLLIDIFFRGIERS
jgi:AcrR family transcriptional regulator